MKSMQSSRDAWTSWVLISTDVEGLELMAAKHGGRPADVQRRSFAAGNVSTFRFTGMSSVVVRHMWRATGVTLTTSDDGRRRELRVQLPAGRSTWSQPVFACLFCFANEDVDGIRRFLRDCSTNAPVGDEAYQHLEKLPAVTGQETDICVIRQTIGDVHVFCEAKDKLPNDEKLLTDTVIVVEYDDLVWSYIDYVA